VVRRVLGLLVLMLVGVVCEGVGFGVEVFDARDKKREIIAYIDGGKVTILDEGKLALAAELGLVVEGIDFARGLPKGFPGQIAVMGEFSYLGRISGVERVVLIDIHPGCTNVDRIGNLVGRNLSTVWFTDVNFDELEGVWPDLREAARALGMVRFIGNIKNIASGGFYRDRGIATVEFERVDFSQVVNVGGVLSGFDRLKRLTFLGGCRRLDEFGAIEGRKIDTLELRDFDLGVGEVGLGRLLDSFKFGRMTFRGGCKNLDKVEFGEAIKKITSLNFANFDFRGAGDVGRVFNGFSEIGMVTFWIGCKNIKQRWSENSKVKEVKFVGVDFSMLGEIGLAINSFVRLKRLVFGDKLKKLFDSKFVANSSVKEVVVRSGAKDFGDTLNYFGSLNRLVFEGIENFGEISFNDNVTVEPPEALSFDWGKGVREILFEKCNFNGIHNMYLEKFKNLKIIEFGSGLWNLSVVKDLEASGVEILKFSEMSGLSEVAEMSYGFPNLKIIIFSNGIIARRTMKPFNRAFWAGEAEKNRTVETLVFKNYGKGLSNYQNRVLKFFDSLKEVVFSDSTVDVSAFECMLAFRGRRVDQLDLDSMVFDNIRFEISERSELDLAKTYFDNIFHLFSPEKTLITSCELIIDGVPADESLLQGLIEDLGYEIEISTGRFEFTAEEVQEVLPEVNGGVAEVPPIPGFWARVKGFLGKIPGGIAGLIGWFAGKFRRTPEGVVAE